MSDDLVSTAEEPVPRQIQEFASRTCAMGTAQSPRTKAGLNSMLSKPKDESQKFNVVVPLAA